jgi:hypothetical protein
MNGIICDLSFTRHYSFITYYYTVRNLYGQPKLVKIVEDLDIDTLFIGDDHWERHRDVWEKPGFIEACNDKNIKVIVFTNERMLNSFFPWNEDVYKNLKRFNNLYHFVCDADDIQLTGLPVNRMALSHSLYKERLREKDKLNEFVFSGCMDCVVGSYDKRKEFIKEAQGKIKLNVLEPRMSWDDYMDTLSRYKFVFCPMGNGNFISLKFYEALMVGSIPVHQVKDNTLDYYPIERELDDCIFFKDIPELMQKLENFNLKSSHNLIFQEDVISEQLKDII